MMDEVTVIIPNWNGKTHLESCLKSLSNQTYNRYSLIIVDNNSNDSSVGFVRNNYPLVEVIELPKNFGFAKAVNIGISHAKTEFIALLNNDIELDPKWMAELVSHLKENPKAGSCACKMMNFFRRNIIDAVGDSLTRSGIPYSRGRDEIDMGQYEKLEYVFGACAGASLYRTELYRKIGLFDEDFISFYEDVDLAFRAQISGYKCLYVPTAVCFHKRGATAKKLARDYIYYMQERNLISVIIKNYPIGLFLIKFPLLIIAYLKRFMGHIIRKRIQATVAGLIAGILMIPKTIPKRRMIQKQRIVSVQEILKIMKKQVENNV